MRRGGRILKWRGCHTCRGLEHALWLGDGIVDASEFHRHGKHHNAKFRKEKDANHADLNFKGNAAAERAEMLRANDENNDGVLDAWEKPQW